MSILMDALKQQSAPQPVVQDSAPFWRKVALLLALLVALLSGALLAYWLQPLALPAVSVPVETAEVVTPARPADILAVLQPAATAAQTAAGVVQEQLVAEKSVTMVTVADDDITAQKAQKSPAAAVAKVEPVAEMVVSDELRDKFSQALKATEQTPQQRVIRSNDAPAPDISTLDAELLQQIPALRFDAHVYATSATQRWVKVNGKTLQEGQWVTADIRIREITQQYVLLQLGAELFSMAALTQWPEG